MSKILLITDSASDLPQKYEQEYGIKVLSYSVAVGQTSYFARKDFTNDGFFKMLDESDTLPTTSQITPFEFEELYTRLYSEKYTDIIMVLINSKGSATYNNAVMTRDLFYNENPDSVTMKITVIDGRSYTSGYGYPVLMAAKLLRDGADAKQITDFLYDATERSIIYAGLYTLKYAARSGRIPSVAAFVGDALGMKPIMRICDNEITTGDKVRGEKKIIPFIAEKLSEQIEQDGGYVVVYGEDSIVRDEMICEATRVVGYPPVDAWQIGAEIAINAGPRVAGVAFLRKKA